MNPASDTDEEYDPFTTPPLSAEEPLVFKIGGAVNYIPEWLTKQKRKIDSSVNSPNTIKNSAAGAYSESPPFKAPPPSFKAPPPRNSLG